MPDYAKGFEPDPDYAKGFTPDPPKSWIDDIFTIPNALRFGGSALGTAAGALATGGLGAGAGAWAGGAAGEAAARWWEGKDFDPTITALEGTLNLLPGGGAIPGKGAALRQVGKYALRQAGHGAWQGAAGALPRHQAEAGNLWSPEKWEMPSAREIGTQTVAGGVIGGGTGGTLGAASSRFGKARPSAKVPLDIPTSEYRPPDIRETFTRPPDTSARDIGEGESILDYISADKPVQRAAPIEPQVMPTMEQVGRNWDENAVTKDDLQTLRMSVFERASDQELQEAADQINRNRETRAQHGAAATPDHVRDSRIIEMEIRRRGLDIPIVPEPFTNPNQRPQPALGAFDPNTLTGLQRTEVEFVDPTTGEVRSSADARPGDVPVMNESKAPTQPSNIDSWMDELIKGESGEFDPTELGRNIRRAFGGEEPTADVPATAARAARVDPESIPSGLRDTISRMSDETIQNLIRSFESNPAAYGQSGVDAANYGRDIIDSRASERAANPQAEAPVRHGDISEQLTQALPPEQRPSTPNTIINGVSGYTRQTIDEQSNEGLLDFIRRHTTAVREDQRLNRAGDATNISRRLVAYANSVADSRGLDVPAESRSLGESARPAESQPIPDNVPLQRESYAEIANAIRGMRGEEAAAYISENSSSLNPTDIQPMIDELMSESPTPGSRVAVRLLESLAESQSVQIPRSRFDVEPTTSHTGGEDEIRPPVSSRITDTVEQVSGMTAEDVRRSFAEQSSNYTRADIAPLLRELERNPTEGTRALAQEIRSRFGDGRSTITPSGGELPVKPPVEVTPEMRERSRKRLAAIGGAERAEKLISGEVVVGSTERAPYRPRTRRGRPNTSEKISPETAEHWNRWGDRQIAEKVTPHSAQPGMTIQPQESYWPQHLVIHYRDAQGNPIGVLETDLAGNGISTLAVSSSLGLGRGKIAFKMLKVAMDRGITEPSGVTSDWTKNLIDRVKSMVRGEEGSLDIDAIVKSLNEIMSGVKASKFGKAVSKFVKGDANALHTIDDLRKIASGQGEVNLYHGTTAENASAIGKEGIKLPQSGEEAARSVADKYGIPWSEWKAFVEPQGTGAGYGDQPRRLSTASLPIAERWAKHFPQGEILSDLNSKARMWKAAKAQGRAKDFDNFYNEIAAKQEAAGGSRSIYDMPDHAGAGSDDLMKPSGEPGKVLSVKVDARSIPKNQASEARFLLEDLESGKITEQQALDTWNKNYRDIKIAPQNVKGIESPRGSLFSRAAKEGKRFLEEETGAVDLGRLQELFQKKQDGTITSEELAEAKAIAQEAKAAPAAETPAPVKTGQVTWSNTRKKKPAAATTTPATPAAPALPRAASLPAELAGAKPRFNIGADSYSPSFADDLDKALFIIAQKTPSKSDAKYLQFVMEQTGLDEQGARLAAQGVRNTIKNQITGQAPGVVRIESIWRKNQQPAATAAPKASSEVTNVTLPPGVEFERVTPRPVYPDEVGNGNIAKAANEKPVAEPRTAEQAAATAMEAEQAAASLAQRLKRATENPNPANSAQEIEELLDEATEVINKVPEKEKAGIIRKVFGANKALLTAWDLSAPGRQGKAFILNKAWWTSLDDMVKAWGSQKAADNIARSIIDHPSGYFKPGVDKFGKPTKSFAEKMGLDLAGVEELFTTNKGSAFEKYSGVGKSSRAHTAFLNKLRSDQFVAMMQSAEKLGLGPKNDLHQAKVYAKFINDATGRGSLNVGKWKLERNLGAINDVMFAPKNLSGQIRTWNGILNPMKYASYDPVMRQQALRSLFAVAGTGLAVGELSRLMGGKIVDDQTSSDFRKIRVGDTRIDLFGGYQQFPVAAMKFLMNAETPTSGRNAGRRIDFEQGGAFRNRASVASRFFTNRLSPAGSFVWAWMNNREFDGKPFEVKRALYERTAPIVLKDLYELAKDDPALAAIMTPTNVIGLTGTQTYGRN